MSQKSPSVFKAFSLGEYLVLIGVFTMGLQGTIRLLMGFPLGYVMQNEPPILANFNMLGYFTVAGILISMAGITVLRVERNRAVAAPRPPLSGAGATFRSRARWVILAVLLVVLHLSFFEFLKFIVIQPLAYMTLGESSRAAIDNPVTSQLGFVVPILLFAVVWLFNFKDRPRKLAAREARRNPTTKKNPFGCLFWAIGGIAVVALLVWLLTLAGPGAGDVIAFLVLLPAFIVASVAVFVVALVSTYMILFG